MNPKYSLSTVFLGLLPYYAMGNNVILDTIEIQSSSSISSYNQGYGAFGTSTATGLPLLLRETPQNVSIISAQQISDQRLDTLGKALNHAVGLYSDVKGSSTSGYSVLYARGNRVRNFQLDGMPSNNVGLGGKGPGDEPNGWGVLNTAQYDRIEILRGATALMDGYGEPSATISLHRKRPTKDPQTTIRLDRGNFNLYGTEIDISFPLNSDNSMRGRFVGAYTKTKTHRERANNRNGMIYGVVEWDVSPQTTFTLGGTYQMMKDRNSSMFGLVLYDTTGNAIPAQRTSNATINGSYVNFNNLNLFTELNHRFSNNNWELKAQYGYTQGHRDQVAGIVGSAFANPTVPMAAGAAVKSDERPRQHNFALSLNGHYQLWGQEHDAMLGISGYLLKNNQPRYIRQMLRLFKSPSQLGNFNGDYPMPEWSANDEDKNKIHQIGVYAATRLRPTDKLSFIVGGRYTHFKVIESTQYVSDGKNSQGSFTPYFGAVYTLNSNFSAYGSYAQIFKPQTKRNKNNQYLNSEKGSNLEFGLKNEFFDGKLNGSLAFFETRKHNVGFCASYSAGNLTCNYYDFSPHTKTRGYEVEVNGQINDQWLMTAGFSQSTEKNNDGKIFRTEVPRRQFKLFTSYTLGNFTFGGGIRWQSKIYEGKPWGLQPGASNELVTKARQISTQKSYSIVDLMVRYRLNSTAELGLNIENLFDKTYRTSVNSHSYGSPRHIVGSFTLKF
ncbi:TonB-dependent siderophore receptor [Rodentibacter genomosp. 2]|uniref:TonB-dependent receptor n=1 Tax=Rodentibacter genomosp. 2 TaxID=1908266 RepID=A0A1V3JAG6_9PAST|nr:TonB-dependent siderophore receptor [Rodentibacter genomosp. 2]OOF53066.1 hypothetical protein BKK55_11780 [Rodentibacter genomosp. 2]